MLSWTVARRRRWTGRRDGLAAVARFRSRHRLARGSISVTTRQIVHFDGARVGALARTQRAYNPASRSAGTSATQPAIAVDDRMPATSAHAMAE